MSSLNTVELKAFVPSKNFELSRQFYKDIGFTMASDENGVAYFHYGKVSFLLQNFYIKELADNFMMHLLVEDVEAWWQKIQEQEIATKYDVMITPPEDRPWKMRDFVMIDPSGVLWRIAQNTP